MPNRIDSSLSNEKKNCPSVALDIEIETIKGEYHYSNTQLS